MSNWGGLRGIGCPLKPYRAMCLGGWWKLHFPICAHSPGFWLLFKTQPDTAGLKGGFEMLTFTTDLRGRRQQPDPDSHYTGEKMLNRLILFSLLCIRQPQGQTPVFLVYKSMGIACQQLFSYVMVFKIQACIVYLSNTEVFKQAGKLLWNSAMCFKFCSLSLQI